MLSGRTRAEEGGKEGGRGEVGGVKEALGRKQEREGKVLIWRENRETEGVITRVNEWE